MTLCLEAGTLATWTWPMPWPGPRCWTLTCRSSSGHTWSPWCHFPASMIPTSSQQTRVLAPTMSSRAPRKSRLTRSSRTSGIQTWMLMCFFIINTSELHSGELKNQRNNTTNMVHVNQDRHFAYNRMYFLTDGIKVSMAWMLKNVSQYSLNSKVVTFYEWIIQQSLTLPWGLKRVESTVNISSVIIVDDVIWCIWFEDID